MTALQKSLVILTIAAAFGFGIYEGRKASKLRQEVQMLQQQQAPLAEQVDQLQRSKETAAAQLAAAQQEIDQLRQRAAEVPRLRGEVSRLQGLKERPAQPAPAAPADDPIA